MKALLVPVERIGPGCFFRKRTGTYVFLRMSDSSAKYLGLDGEKKVYGTCYNGNVAAVPRGELVVPALMADMVANLASEKHWERVVGVETPSARCRDDSMKVLEPGNGAKGWSVELRCTGSGNGGGGCGAKLLVEGPDLYETRSHDHGGGMDSFLTFRCNQCGVQTDLDKENARRARQAVSHIPYRTQTSLRGGTSNDPL